MNFLCEKESCFVDFTMLNKAKFKLLLYQVENDLIIYNSLNRVNKFIAFSIFETVNDFKILFILNDYLNERILSYYSIQLDLKDSNKITFILNFQDKTKEKVIQLFNIIHHDLSKFKSSLKFFSNESLEKRFLSIIDENLNSNFLISEILGSIYVKNNNIATIFNLYYLILTFSNNNFFLQNFLSLIKNYHLEGYIVITFKNNPKDCIMFTSYFINKAKNKISDNALENDINNFYGHTLIKKQKLSPKNVFQILWRSEINKCFLLFNDVNKFFLNENKISDLSSFNSKLNDYLKRNDIDFIRLSKNLLLLNSNKLLLISINLQSELIRMLLKRYYKKYLIYILILNEEEYEKLRKFNEISHLKDLFIINPEEFLNLNDEKFKKLLD